MAVAVVALATGVGFGRSMVVGGAEAAPVSPPPQIGDCLYSNLVGLVGVPRADGSREDYGYGRRYADSYSEDAPGQVGACQHSGGERDGRHRHVGGA